MRASSRASSRTSLAGPWPLVWVLAWRYLRGRRSRLLSRTGTAALMSISLGVMAMVIAMALMSGYRTDLEQKLVGGNASVLVYPLDPENWEDASEGLVDQLEKLSGVDRVGRVAYGQGTISRAEGGESLAVTLRGIDERTGGLTATREQLAPRDGIAGVVLGEELARRLRVEPGAMVRLIALGIERGRPRFRYRGLRVTGTFGTGFAEFDNSWVVADREMIASVVGSGGGNQLLEVALEDPGRAPKVAELVRAGLGPDFLVTDWRQLNRSLFSALELQQWLLFFLLGLIVVVSTFNVASTLIVLVRERRRDVGVLASVGLPPTAVAAVFVAYGFVLAVIGCTVGVAAGTTISWLLTKLELIRFDPEVAQIYFLDAVRFRVAVDDLAAVVAFALSITVISCLLPAWRAARIAPADALHYE